jgi:hypothetical protein
MRRRPHRRRHLRKTRSGGGHLTSGMPCSCPALRLVQGRELPPTSCVATPATNYPNFLVTTWMYQPDDDGSARGISGISGYPYP